MYILQYLPKTSVNAEMSAWIDASICSSIFALLLLISGILLLFAIHYTHTELKHHILRVSAEFIWVMFALSLILLITSNTSSNYSSPSYAPHQENFVSPQNNSLPIYHHYYYLKPRMHHQWLKAYHGDKKYNKELCHRDANFRNYYKSSIYYLNPPKAVQRVQKNQRWINWAKPIIKRANYHSPKLYNYF